MKHKPQLVRAEERKIIYKIPSLMDINDSLLKDLKWPKKIPLLWLKFDKGMEKCHEFLSKKVSRKYETQIIYSAPARSLFQGKNCSNKKSIKMAQNIALSDLRTVYLRTQAESYVMRWAEELDHRYFEETASFVKNDLPSAKSVHFLKNKSVVGQLIFLELSDKIGLVAWIWIDPLLNKPERKCVHNGVLKWLQKQRTPEIKSVVNDYNSRSNLFFQKMGFTPECVAISRRS